MSDSRGMDGKRVYYDNSATTAVSDEALEAMIPFFCKEYGNPSSIHFMGDETAKALRDARGKVARSLGCRPSEVTFTSGGTESDNIALIGAMTAPGDRRRIVTTAIEHPAVLETCEELRRRGFEITVLGVDSEGFVDPSDLEDAMDDDVRVVSVMAANNVVGTIQNIPELARIAHDHGAFFHTDAVQAYTKVDIDVRRDGIDMLSLSGHKIHAPKGIGAVFVRTGVPIRPAMFGGGQESGLRSSTENVPGIVGLGVAAESAMSTMTDDIRKMTEIRDEIIDKALRIPGAHLNGPTEHRLCNNAHFSFDGVKGMELVLKLSARGYAASTASACSAGTTEPSHVLMAMGLSQERAISALRITLSRYNTMEEAEGFAPVLASIIGTMRH